MPGANSSDALPTPSRWDRLRAVLRDPLKPMTGRRFAGLAALGALPLVLLTFRMLACEPTSNSARVAEAWRGCFGWLYAGWMGFLLQARFRHLPRAQEIALRLYALSLDIRALVGANPTLDVTPGPFGAQAEVPGFRSTYESLAAEAFFYGMPLADREYRRTLGRLVSAEVRVNASADAKETRSNLLEAAALILQSAGWVRR